MTSDNGGVKYPGCEVELIGHDGNAMAILGRVRRALRDHLRSSGADAPTIEHEVTAFTTEATKGDYNALLQTCMRWVSVT